MTGTTGVHERAVEMEDMNGPNMIVPNMTGDEFDGSNIARRLIVEDRWLGHGSIGVNPDVT